MYNKNFTRLFGAVFAGLGMFNVFAGADAAINSGRASYGRVAGSIAAANARMPSMPTLPGMAVGNTTQNVPSNTPDVPSVPNVPDVNVPDVPEMPIIPNVPDKPNKPGRPDKPGHPDKPGDSEKPAQGCADGGVENSTYTVENCMDDVLRCVNSGESGLVGGLNEFFNPDIRNSIENGMGICTTQIAKCVSDVRQDCSDVYRGTADVWIDFNSRRVQPEYFSFVLRKTGLTPNQAEAVCLMLDQGVKDSSFNEAKASELGGAAYSKQYNGVSIKNVKQSVMPENRGKFARWDAASATCHVRIGAYNKDEQITNSWLFGGAGDDRVAEVWKPVGESFNCNKDLFGFSLMTDTKTAAVVGVAGGTLLGAGVGAVAGHGDQSFDCSKEAHRKQLTDALAGVSAGSILSEYMVSSYPVAGANETVSADQCYEIVDIYDAYNQFKSVVDSCGGYTVVTAKHDVELICDMDNNTDVAECFKLVAQQKPIFQICIDKNATTVDECVNLVVAEMNKESVISRADCKDFKSVKQVVLEGTDIYCTPGSSDCQTLGQIETELAHLGSALAGDVMVLLDQGVQGNRGKATAIGAASGAAAGGLATAITAFVEKNNISCRVGDNLEQVAFGRNHIIGTLRDFYVKWKLNLPDTISPSGNVVDCNSWQSMCAMYTDLGECTAAQFNYKPAGANKIVAVPSACVVSGSACVANYPVSKSYGACK